MQCTRFAFLRPLLRPTLVLLAAVGTFVKTASAQVPLERVSLDPAQLAEAFVRNQISPPTAALTGEAAANPISADLLPKAPRIRAELLWRGGGRALVATEFSNDISAQDLYVFLDSTDAGWRISAFRDVELPGVFYNQLNHYRNKGENAIRQDWQARYEASASRGVSREAHERAHGSADERVFYVFNLRLTSSSDADVVRHFEMLKPEFEALRQNLQRLPRSPIPLGHDNDAVGDDLRYLLIKRAFHDTEGPLRLEISNIQGVDVGYLYCTDASCMPTPTPGGVIALREIGEGWWLYRTN